MLLPAGHTYSSYMGAFLEEYLVKYSIKSRNLHISLPKLQRSFKNCSFVQYLPLYVRLVVSKRRVAEVVVWLAACGLREEGNNRGKWGGRTNIREQRR